MENDIYTLGYWRVKPGKQAEFVAAWKSLGDYFVSFPQPPGKGTLVQSVEDDSLFYSFGRWPSLDAVQAMRADSRTPAEIGKLAALCEEASPGSFREVAQSG